MLPGLQSVNFVMWQDDLIRDGYFLINKRLSPLELGGNYSATSNNMKLVHWHWQLMGGLVHLVQRGGAWAGCGPSSMFPLCWHHDTTGVVDSSGYPWRPHLSGCCSACIEQSAIETLACSSLLTFRKETKSHLFRQSYGWRGAVYSDGQQTSALSCATV